MKVKIFSCRSTTDLENYINEFFAENPGCTIVDIKFSTSESFSEALIMYKPE